MARSDSSDGFLMLAKGPPAAAAPVPPSAPAPAMLWRAGAD